jgi:NADH dehydrogenase [ubiquinone] 1 alpha subcomplex assembly factor 5
MDGLGSAGLPPHMPGMTDAIFDSRAVRLHRDRAAGRVERVAPILAEVADRLLDRLDDMTRRFTRALDVGGRGQVAPRLRARGIETVSCELSPAMARLDGAVVGDPEWLPFAPASFDLVVANLSLHFCNDLPGALIQLRAAMRPDGLLLASMPALGTLGELRAALAEAEADLTGGASPRVAPFAGLADCAGLLQRAGFALPVADTDSLTLLYTDPLSLLRDLQAAGETNAVALRDRRTPPRALFPAALTRLPTDDGRARATLRLAMMTGWAPGPAQPKPAARGSATTSLADALDWHG